MNIVDRSGSGGMRDCGGSGACFELQKQGAFQKMIPSFYDGSEFAAYTFFGAHIEPDGVLFRVYAPNANEVSVIGDFNDWQPTPMEREENPGVWYLWYGGAREGQRYKYRIDEYGERIRDRADPYGTGSELRPATCSVITETGRFQFTDERWMRERGFDYYNRPINIYEVHMGSWRRPDGEGWYTCREIAADLIAHVKAHGFTHIELLPLSEHPSDESWGYQVAGYFCPTPRYGTAEDLQYFVNECHLNGIGVLFDFVPVHFATDDYALFEFDGTHLYEYPFEDVKHSEWGSCNFNFSRGEVRSFLQSAAHYWLDVYHFDGLRMDAVRNAIYWQGDEGRGVNHDAIAFLRGMNSGLKERFPTALLIAEDSSAYLKVTAPVEYDGLGFDFKWDLGWMHDTLEFFQLPPEQRCIQYGRLCWPMSYFYNDLFLLPLSHDEVVHGKGTILQRMWGDYDTKFPQGRTFYTLMFTQPGKKLNFMGNEIGQLREWDEKREQDWELVKYPLHDGFRQWFAALSRLYFIHPALHEDEYNSAAFRWIENGAPSACVYAYERGMGRERVLAVLNLSQQAHYGFRLGLDRPAELTEALNSDWTWYGGSTKEKSRTLHTEAVPHRDMPYSFTTDLAPFGSIVYLVKGDCTE